AFVKGSGLQAFRRGSAAYVFASKQFAATGSRDVILTPALCQHGTSLHRTRCQPRLFVWQTAPGLDGAVSSVGLLHETAGQGSPAGIMRFRLTGHGHRNTV